MQHWRTAKPLLACFTAVSVTAVSVPLVLAAQTPMAIGHVPPLGAVANQDLTLIAAVTGDVGEATVQLYYRAGVRADYRSLKMTKTFGSTYVALIPGAQVSAGVFEYYVVAMGQAGQSAHLGSNGAPLSLLVATPTLRSNLESRRPIEEPGTMRPWYKKWWVWTFLGGAAAGGVAGGTGGDGGDGHPGMVH